MQDGNKDTTTPSYMTILHAAKQEISLVLIIVRQNQNLCQVVSFVTAKTSQLRCQNPPHHTVLRLGGVEVRSDGEAELCLSLHHTTDDTVEDTGTVLFCVFFVVLMTVAMQYTLNCRHAFTSYTIHWVNLKTGMRRRTRRNMEGNSH